MIQIAQVVGVEPTRQNIEVLKKFLKRMFGIDSLRDLDNIGMQWFMTKIAVLFATEFAFTLDMPGEENVEDMDLREMLKLYYGETETTRKDSTDTKSSDGQTVE